MRVQECHDIVLRRGTASCVVERLIVSMQQILQEEAEDNGTTFAELPADAAHAWQVHAAPGSTRLVGINQEVDCGS